MSDCESESNKLKSVKESTPSTSKLPWGLSNDNLAPGSMKTITETKIKAFQLGAMNIAKRGFTRKEVEQNKRKQEEMEAKKVYDDFIASFGDAAHHQRKNFIRGNVINSEFQSKTTVVPNSSDESNTVKSDKSKLAKNIAKVREKIMEQQMKLTKSSTPDSSKDTRSSSKLATKEKQKTNLEVFKDELKRIQEERDRRSMLKQKLQSQEESGRKTRFEPFVDDTPIQSELSLDDVCRDNYTSEDAASTNIFLSNLSRSLNETEIIEVFGKFGVLASVKIMYPRTEEEIARGTNCGFVAFMKRQDALKALETLDGMELGGLSIRLSWGKSVNMPLQPMQTKQNLVSIDIENTRSENVKTGYPFNAQPPLNYPKLSEQVDRPLPPRILKLLASTTINVTVPNDKKLLLLIHRTIEFVIKYGPKFEQALINREQCNPLFRFIYDNDCSHHIYYRWKLFSLLQGDSLNQWRVAPFKMFENGSMWIPPNTKDETNNQGVSEFGQHLSVDNRDDKRNKYIRTTNKLESMLNKITAERECIADLMVYCIEKAHLSSEVIESILKAFKKTKADPQYKIALLYLISDILHNSSCGIFNASSYRSEIEKVLPAVFQCLAVCSQSFSGKIKGEQFKAKVISCFQAWEEWALYPTDLLIRMQNIFIGLYNQSDAPNSENVHSSNTEQSKINLDLSNDQEDIDGIPFTKDSAELSTEANKCNDDIDIDGEPLSFIDNNRTTLQTTAKQMFVESKWESVGNVTSKSKDDTKGKTKRFIGNQRSVVEYGQSSECESSLTNRSKTSSKSAKSKCYSASSNKQSSDSKHSQKSDSENSTKSSSFEEYENSSSQSSKYSQRSERRRKESRLRREKYYNKNRDQRSQRSSNASDSSSRSADSDSDNSEHSSQDSESSINDTTMIIDESTASYHNKVDNTTDDRLKASHHCLRNKDIEWNQSGPRSDASYIRRSDKRKLPESRKSYRSHDSFKYNNRRFESDRKRSKFDSKRRAAFGTPTRSSNRQYKRTNKRTSRSLSTTPSSQSNDSEDSYDSDKRHKYVSSKMSRDKLSRHHKY